MNLGPHFGFILASYLATASIVAGLILWALIDYRAQRRALARFEERGVSRRSELAATRMAGRLGAEASGQG